MIKNPFDKDYGGWIFMGIIFLFLKSSKFFGIEKMSKTIKAIKIF